LEVSQWSVLLFVGLASAASFAAYIISTVISIFVIGFSQQISGMDQLLGPEGQDLTRGPSPEYKGRKLTNKRGLGVYKLSVANGPVPETQSTLFFEHQRQ
jgi:hypothetical protein